MRAGIIFDFDDTLVYTNEQFTKAKELFFQELDQLDLLIPDLAQVLDKYDIANIKAAGGFALSCFPQALADTYRYACQQKGRRADNLTAQRLANLGWKIFQQPLRRVPGAEELLKALGKEYPLFLLTKGDVAHQKKRVVESGLAGYFSDIAVVDQKDPACFKRLIAIHHLDAAASWSVGNSISWDLNTAFLAGLQGLLVTVTEHWDFEEGDALTVYPQVKNLADCWDIIKGGKPCGQV